MAKTSNCERFGRDFECFVPDYGDLDKLYSMDICTNDIDIAIRNKHLQSIVDTLLVDTSVPQPPRMSDEELVENFIGKEYEYDDIVRVAREREKDFRKLQSQKKEDDE